MRTLLRLSMGLIACLTTSVAAGQFNDIAFFGPEKKIVKLDPFSNIAESDYPFDRTFYIVRYLKTGTPPIKAVYIGSITSRARYSKTLGKEGVVAINSVDFEVINADITQTRPDYPKMAAILVPPLNPGNPYDLIFDYAMTVERRQQLADAFIAYHAGNTAAARNAVDAINAQKSRVNDTNEIRFPDFEAYYQLEVKYMFADAHTRPADIVTMELRNTLVQSLDMGGKAIPTPRGRVWLFLDTEILSAAGTQAFKLETRAEAQVVPEYGALFYGFGGTGDVGLNKDFLGVMPYVGFSIQLRPFDAHIPMRLIRHRLQPWHRLSFHAGVTLLSLAKDPYRENLFNGQNLLLGLGYRLNSALKVQGGLLLYRKRTDPSPLNTNTTVCPIGYVGLAVDLRLRNVLGDIGKVFTK